MSERETRSGSRDLVLAQNEFALVQDGASALVQVVRGPEVYSPGQNDSSMVYDPDRDAFRKCNLTESVQRWPAADERQYIVLTNPVQDKPNKHPEKGKSSAPDLSKGRQVNIPGPVTFALFPGQAAKVIDGHILRSNQFLVVRVSNGEEAMKNWAQAVLKPQTSSGEITADGGSSDTGDQAPPAGGSDADTGDQAPPAGGQEDGGAQAPTPPPAADEPKDTGQEDDGPPQLVTGQLLIIKGTEVSFYIPPTGIEVVQDERGNYVREAVTLEQLDYCILLDESGEKEFVRGPSVVFPKPTQTFYTNPDGSRKSKAIELQEHWGIHIKVIKAYGDHQEGDELFITGKDQTIYFPREEHAIVTYRDQMIHYAVAVPEGEARHVLNRETGAIKTVVGPKMLLPDPRKEVVVRRTLPLNLVELLYPNNPEALEHNRRLLAQGGLDIHREVERMHLDDDSEASSVTRGRRSEKRLRSFGTVDGAEVGADEFSRRTSFTPPRTIQLDTKYDGAVTVRIWTGYAIKLVNKTGKSRVVVGPATVLLNYDEEPEIFELSTGTPKTDDRLHRDVFLRVKANKVSDEVTAETSDFVTVRIPVSYRVNFEGDNDKWFDVEDYVKFLTDHLRSLIANIVKQHGIEAFYAGYIDILRDAILGKQTQGDGGETVDRPGRPFEENGMRIYDVEFGQLEIGDSKIAGMLQTAQHDSVSDALKLAGKQRQFDTTRKVEELDRKIADEELATELARHDRELKGTTREEEVKRKTAAAVAQTGLAKQDVALQAAVKGEEVKRDTAAAEAETDQAGLNLNHQAALKQEERQREADTAVAETTKAKLEQDKDRLTAELEVIAARVANDLKEIEDRRQADVAAQEDLDAVAAAELSRQKAKDDQRLAAAKEELEQQVKAIVDKASAITPDLVAALQAFADKHLAVNVAEAVAPMSVFGGKSIQEVLAGILSGTSLENIAREMVGKPGAQPEAPQSGD